MQREPHVRTMVRRVVVPLGAPLVRAYMQNRIRWGKERFWRSVGQRFSRQDHDFRARTQFGAVVHGNTRDMIQSLIYYFGVWEPYVTAFIRARLRPGDVFVDVGANIGYYALCASLAVGAAGNVVAFEASPETHRQLLANLSANRADNVRVVHCAVGSEKGKLALYRGPIGNSGMATTVPSGEVESILECEVEADTLHALLQEDEIRRARIIKIDVEGGEWAVAQGMRSLLSMLRPDVEILMEVAPERIASLGHSAEDLLDVFRSRGFNTYALENRYDSFSYIPPLPDKAAMRIHRLDGQTDVVFSRVDAQAL